MVFTFPVFGSLKYIIPKIMDEFGVEYVLPHQGEDTLRKGSRLAPEEMCLPFKYMLGGLMEAYEHGADTVIMLSTAGPCRLGEYGELMSVVLDNAGYRYKWIMLDPPSETGLTEMLRRIGTIIGDGKHMGLFRIFSVFLKALMVLHSFEKTERQLLKKAGYLKTPQEAVRLMASLEQGVGDADSLDECRKAIRKTRKSSGLLKKSGDTDPVRVMVTGEIYTSVESSANMNIEKHLAAQGCSVIRCIDITWWIKQTLCHMADSLITVRLFRRLKRKLCGTAGIPCCIGGYGRETAAMIVSSAERADGVIKMMPSGCMPEIVAKAYCENREDQDSVPVLNLIFDEMYGDAGYETRIEAFTDMLERRKNVLAGNRHRLHKHRSCCDR